MSAQRGEADTVASARPTAICECFQHRSWIPVAFARARLEYKFRDRWIPVALPLPAGHLFLVHLENARRRCAFSTPIRHIFQENRATRTAIWLSGRQRRSDFSE